MLIIFCRISLQMKMSYNLNIFLYIFIYVTVKRVIPRFGRDFLCRTCKKQVDDGLVEPVEELYEEVETVRGFCYFGVRVNANNGCEAAVTGRSRIRCLIEV